MQHRHLNSEEWTLAAIDSALERGDLPDWRELFAAAREDLELARRILHVARSHDIPGSSVMAVGLVERLWPELVATRAA